MCNVFFVISTRGQPDEDYSTRGQPDNIQTNRGRIKPDRIKRAALTLQNQSYYIWCFLIRPRLYIYIYIYIHYTLFICLLGVVSIIIININE